MEWNAYHSSPIHHYGRHTGCCFHYCDKSTGGVGWGGGGNSKLHSIKLRENLHLAFQGTSAQLDTMNTLRWAHQESQADLACCRFYPQQVQVAPDLDVGRYLYKTQKSVFHLQ